jgi:hypothetical protein
MPPGGGPGVKLKVEREIEAQPEERAAEPDLFAELV